MLAELVWWELTPWEFTMWLTSPHLVLQWEEPSCDCSGLMPPHLCGSSTNGIHITLQNWQGERDSKASLGALPRGHIIPPLPYLLTLPYQPYPLDMKGKRQKGTKRTGKYLPWATRCKRLREFRALCNRSLSVIHFTHSSVYMTVPKSRAHANLLSVMCQPGWSGVGGAGLHVHMAESLLCSPETPTTLLTG